MSCELYSGANHILGSLTGANTHGANRLESLALAGAEPRVLYDLA